MFFDLCLQVDDLSKTLPHSFHFPLDVTEQEEEKEEEKRPVMPKRERGGHSHSLSTCGVPMNDIRDHPVAEERSNLVRLSMGLGHSDPSLLAQVCITCVCVCVCVCVASLSLSLCVHMYLYVNVFLSH